MRTALSKRQRLALRILDWHGGQDTGLYALGSSWFANHEVPLCVVNRACSELSRIAAKQVPFPETVTEKTITEVETLMTKIMIMVKTQGE